MNRTETPQSEFNSAISFLNRLNGLHWTANDAAINLNLHLWYQTLLALYRSLSTEMIDDDFVRLEALRKEIIPRLSNYNRREGTKAQNVIPEDLLSLLHDFEISLYSVEKRSGISLKMKQMAGEVISHGQF